MKKITNKTLIIGSGINNLMYPTNHFLCSWPNFTRHFFHSVSGDNSPATLLMEGCIRQNAIGNRNSRDAAEMEKIILENIALQIKSSEVCLEPNELDWILNFQGITDIICLNFNLPFGLTKDDLTTGNKSLNPKRERETYNNFQFWTSKKANNHKIRFWFPHGNILNPHFMVFGAFRYMKQNAYINHLFRNLKKRERLIFKNSIQKSESDLASNGMLENRLHETDISWLNPFFFNELYFLGTSISTDEWDLWSALTLRIRNFNKSENRKYEHPIFHMRSGGLKDTSYPQFIQPLYDTEMSFNEQWKKLKEDFSNSKE
jgi:hypothetical protein